jgi:hypothetical protein
MKNHLKKLYSISRFLRLNLLAKAIPLLTLAGATGCAESKQEMIPFTFDLPNHVLHYSLPGEMFPPKWHLKLNKKFDTQDIGWVKNKDQLIVRLLHDIDSPFWIVGPYGSLQIFFSVSEKERGYGKKINDIKGLEEYIRWSLFKESYSSVRENFKTVNLINCPSLGEAYGIMVSYSIPARDERTLKPGEWSLFPGDYQSLYIPLTDEIFLHLSIEISDCQGGRGRESRWKPKAEAMRQAIQGAIRLEPKPVTEALQNSPFEKPTTQP